MRRDQRSIMDDYRKNADQRAMRGAEASSDEVRALWLQMETHWREKLIESEGKCVTVVDTVEAIRIS